MSEVPPPCELENTLPPAADEVDALASDSPPLFAFLKTLLGAERSP